MFFYFFFIIFFFFSGFFNGARFFDLNSGIGDAAGALFMIMGGAWFFGAPLAVVLIIMVRLSRLQRVVVVNTKSTVSGLLEEYRLQ